MQPTLLFRSGLLGGYFFRKCAPRVLTMTARLSSDLKMSNDESRKAMQDNMDRWDTCNEVFFGSQRDFKNFPTPSVPEKCEKVRLGLVPETWFTAVYEKTGVTGPYLFGIGLVTTLLSKEIWVIDHGFVDAFCFTCAIYIVHVYAKDKLEKFLRTVCKKWEMRYWNQPVGINIRINERCIAKLEKVIWQEEAQKYLWQTKKENIELQLEAAYRKRLYDMYKDVKNRLDYQLEVENVRRRYQQTHLVNWVIDSVLKGITPQQEKESIKSCISQLKLMSSVQA